ncbi:MAG: hypothetical protein ACK5SX_11740, partial [Sandaracinobacter sp.]
MVPLFFLAPEFRGVCFGEAGVQPVCGARTQDQADMVVHQAPIATLGDMVRDAGAYDAGQASHGAS